MMRRLMFFALGVFFGAALGSTLAMLLTPASGDDLRKRAKNHVDRALEAGREAADIRRREMEAQLKVMVTPSRRTSKR